MIIENNIKAITNMTSIFDNVPKLFEDVDNISLFLGYCLFIKAKPDLKGKHRNGIDALHSVCARSLNYHIDSEPIFRREYLDVWLNYIRNLAIRVPRDQPIRIAPLDAIYNMAIDHVDELDDMLNCLIIIAIANLKKVDDGYHQKQSELKRGESLSNLEYEHWKSIQVSRQLFAERYFKSFAKYESLTEDDYKYVQTKLDHKNDRLNTIREELDKVSITLNP